MVFNARPLRDAEALIEQGDGSRASEKLWDAVSQSLRAAAHAWTAEGPREMRRLADQLYRRTGDRDLLRLFSVAESLRANAAEDLMSPEALRACADDVRALLEKLASVPPGSDGAADLPQTPGPEAAFALRRAGFSGRTRGLSRRETRRELLTELARVEGELESATGRSGQREGVIPGLPESRIARALQPRAAPEDDPMAGAARRYREWLLEALAGPAPRLPAERA